MESMRSWNYYEVLDVPTHAHQSDIYAAYLKAKEIYSLSEPQIFSIFTPEEALIWLQFIEEAYSVVGDPESRKIYDERINLQSSAGSMGARSAHSKPLETPPPGYAYTLISTYAVDETMEKWIREREIFDGSFLKKVREYKNIDLKKFSQATCIALRYLYAIENNTFMALPVAVFVRGYICQYCRFLDLPKDKVVPFFMSLFSNEKS